MAELRVMAERSGQRGGARAILFSSCRARKRRLRSGRRPTEALQSLAHLPSFLIHRLTSRDSRAYHGPLAYPA